VDEKRMIRANAMVTLENKTSQEAAAWLLRECLGAEVEAPRGAVGRGWNWAAVGANTARHLQLVGLSLLVAIAVGIPLGVLASRSRLLANVTLSLAGLLQTVPSLALLAFLVPLLGVGLEAALVALFLYSLLPIVRNTYTGLTTIPGNLAEAAEAIGLTPAAQLLQVRLPMASPSILAGIKTSAVINVGTATLAALVGAGGLGQPILQGISLLDNGLILQGAVPAAALALLVQGAFDLLERRVVPLGLRL
ncbi:MAG: ABC transporter permease, partial [Candidatus Eremiobacterota bacterium]